MEKKTKIPLIEFIYSPQCPFNPLQKLELAKIAARYKAILKTYNLWNINENQLRTLPPHIRKEVISVRKYRQVNHLHGLVFVDGKPLCGIPIDKKKIATLVRKAIDGDKKAKQKQCKR